MSNSEDCSGLESEICLQESSQGADFILEAVEGLGPTSGSVGATIAVSKKWDGDNREAGERPSATKSEFSEA